MEKQKKELVRKNMYMSEEVAEWYEVESEKIGVSQSALMTMVLKEHIDEKKNIEMFGSMGKILKFMEENAKK